MLVSVHICAYLFISQNFILKKKPNFSKKMNFDCRYVLKKGAPVRTSKIQNSLIRTRNRSLDLSVLCSRLNHWADTAVKIFALFWYIFLKHVYIYLYLSISVHIYTYLLISVYICAYLFISQNFILSKKNLIFQKNEFWL